MRSKEAAFVDGWIAQQANSQRKIESVEGEIGGLRDRLLEAAQREGFMRPDLEQALGQDLDEYLIDACKAALGRIN